MSTNTQISSSKQYCNHLAIERGLDPVGHAGDFDDAVIIEMPLPWKYNIAQQENLLPPEMVSLMDLWLKRYHEGHGYRHRPLLIAPDSEYSVDGYRRVMFYTRPDGLFAEFTKIEYLVPEEKLGQLIWSLYETRHLLAEFEQYRVEEGDQIRDILVCTHGAVDAACAKFGYPLFKTLREDYANEALRVWRVSHFGGHVFAPTVMDMPVGHYWAYVEAQQADQIVMRSGDRSAMKGHYRGWAGIERGFLQVAECELWQLHGWQWFDALKSGEVVTQEDSPEPTWADVRIHYKLNATMAETTATMRVEISHTIETNPSTGKDHSYPYPQYRVAKVNDNSLAVKSL